MIYLISGNGRGAGKTTLARRLVGEDQILSHANELREQLNAEYPTLPWFDVSQEEKDKPRYELGGRSMRDLLVQYGQEMCKRNTLDYWARVLGGKIEEEFYIYGWPSTFLSIAVDDLRKTVELQLLREKLGKYGILHFHLKSESAIPEPEYDGTELEQLADYVITRKD